MDSNSYSDETNQNGQLSEPQVPQRLPITFRGDGAEYFKIWIVNLLLTIITLGVYSAWAKVRTRRYFDGNTYLDGSNFDYHADPLKILKGRVLVAAILCIYAVGGKIYPPLAIASLILFFALLPWIIVRALIFNLTNTSYRNIRFGFQKDYKGSYATAIIGFFVTFLTLGIGLPYAHYLRVKFRVTRCRYGASFFNFSGTVKDMYRMYLGGVVIALVIGVIFFLLLVMSNSLKFIDVSSAFTKTILVGISMLGIYLGIIAASVFVYMQLFNYAVKNTKIEGISFEGELKYGELWSYLITNYFLCLFTLGFAYPWAKIRLLKYRLSKISVVAPTGELERFHRQNQDASGSTADAAADFWDIDLGF